MKIQPVSFANYQPQGIRTQTTNYPKFRFGINSIAQDTFTGSYNGYPKVLKDAIDSTIKKDTQAEQIFLNLYKSLIKEKYITTTPEFETLIDIYKKSGFLGFLRELWKAYPQEKIAKIIDGKYGENIPLVKQNENSVFELMHMGKHGFFGDNPNDIKVVFRNKENTIAMEYGLNKKGELQTTQSGRHNAKYSEFYSSSGNRKYETIHSEYSNPETTYYKKDGSIDYFKTWLRGGTANPTAW